MWRLHSARSAGFFVKRFFMFLNFFFCSEATVGYILAAAVIRSIPQTAAIDAFNDVSSLFVAVMLLVTSIGIVVFAAVMMKYVESLLENGKKDFEYFCAVRTSCSFIFKSGLVLVCFFSFRLIITCVHYFSGTALPDWLYRGLGCYMTEFVMCLVVLNVLLILFGSDGVKKFLTSFFRLVKKKNVESGDSSDSDSVSAPLLPQKVPDAYII
jgi:hypothetical protein